MIYLPSGDEVVVVDDEVSRSIQVGNKKREDDIDGEEKVNDEINGQKSSISSFLESQLKDRCPRRVPHQDHQIQFPQPTNKYIFSFSLFYNKVLMLEMIYSSYYSESIFFFEK